MPRYAITEKAGPFVAAHRNTGVGTILELTECQAEHELRLGTLMPLDRTHAELEVPNSGTPEAVEGDTANVPPLQTKPRRYAKA